MVNVLVPDLPSSVTEAEISQIIQYLRQLHSIRGFEKIYVSETNILNKISLEYVRELPSQIEDEVKNSTRNMVSELDSILWDIKKTDHREANLSPFVFLYSLWLKAKSIKAVVIFSRLHILSPILYLCQILTNSRRDYIGNLAEDIELWFFSHFADFEVQVPFFFNVTQEIEDSFRKYAGISKLKETLDFLCNYPNSANEWKNRNKALIKLMEYTESISQYAKNAYKWLVMFAPFPITLTNGVMKAPELIPWNYPTLKELLKDKPMRENNFNPYFIQDTIYPKELLQKVALAKEIPPEKASFFKLLQSEVASYRTIELARHKFLKRLPNF